MVQVLLLEELGHQRIYDASIVLDDLRSRLEEITGLSAIDVTPRGRSSAIVNLPARNRRESERMKDLLRHKLDGWKVVEAQQFNLPQTF